LTRTLPLKQKAQQAGADGVGADDATQGQGQGQCQGRRGDSALNHIYIFSIKEVYIIGATVVFVVLCQNARQVVIHSPQVVQAPAITIRNSATRAAPSTVAANARMMNTFIAWIGQDLDIALPTPIIWQELELSVPEVARLKLLMRRI
jgi:hypothetical protein